MSEQQPLAWDSVALSLGIAVVCAAIGLVGLPFIFGGNTSPGAAPLWLLAATVISVYLLLLVPRFSRPLARELQGRLGSSSSLGPTITPSQTRLLSRLVVLAVMLVVVQAVLRRPLSLLVGGAPVESGIAAAALAVTLALLVWMYQTARPMLQATTLRVIDAAIPTVGAAPLSEPTHTVQPVDVARTQRVTTDDAPTLRAQPNGEATVVTQQPVGDATVVTQHPEGDATVVTQHPVGDVSLVTQRPEEGKTVIAPRVNDEHTIRVDDATLPGERSNA